VSLHTPCVIYAERLARPTTAHPKLLAGGLSRRLSGDPQHRTNAVGLHQQFRNNRHLGELQRVYLNTEWFESVVVPKILERQDADIT
jgi:hypothetical protein